MDEGGGNIPPPPPCQIKENSGIHEGGEAELGKGGWEAE